MTWVLKENGIPLDQYIGLGHHSPDSACPVRYTNRVFYEMRVIGAYNRWDIFNDNRHFIFTMIVLGDGHSLR